MLSKSSVTTSAAVATMALASAATAAPVSSNIMPGNCKSLGKGAFGYNSSAIGLYSTQPPNVYLTVDANQHNRIVKSDTPTYENQTMFEFFGCEYTAPPNHDEGTVETYQGFIKAPNGQCVSILGLYDDSNWVETYDCIFNENSAMGNVAAAQHVQLQLDTFYDFYSVVFLGETPGPVNASDFGAGGNYHFRIDEQPKPYVQQLVYSYESKHPQTGDLKEMLIAQIGDQYVPTKKVLPACKEVHKAALELVNTKTGEVQRVTADGPPQSEHGFSVVLNASGRPYFSFLQCDSTYMGYESDDNNFYGHFRADAFNNTAVYIKQTGGSANNVILEAYETGATAPEYDDESQIPAFFHMTKTSDGYYQVNYLGARAADNAGQYGWMPIYQPNTPDGKETTIFVDKDTTDYQLRFKY